MKKLKCPSEELWTHGSLVRKLLFLLFWFVGISAFGQTDKQISVSFVNEDAVSALRKVEELSGQKIQYNYEDVNFRVTYRATNATATKIITDIIKNHNLKLQRKGNYLVIMPETKKLYKGSVIEGKIVDEHGEPLIGASVQMRGSGKGVITDVNGNYSFVPSTNEGTVIISYIGYTTQEISLERFADMRRINMKLDQDNVLKDVVITGIYTRNVESFTGSATTFSEKELKQIGNSNVLQSLKTLDPSFNLMDNNTMGSDPNQTLQIEVRGKTNVAGLTEEYVNDPNQPLFILDGFESTLATISDLSMDRVQSITLLKDAAATAIYGSKAANGVVVVETKAPEAGKLRVNYNGNFGFTWADLTDYNLMNAREKLEFELLTGCYRQIDPEAGQSYFEDYAKRYNDVKSEIERGVDTYWLSVPIRFAVSHSHNIFVEGGDKTFRYGVGANFGNTEGVMKGSGRKTANGNIKLIYRAGKFAFSNNLNINYSKAEHESVAFSKFALASPYLRKYDENGNIPLTMQYDGFRDEIIYNPMYDWQFNNQDNSKSSGFNNNFETEWRPIEELRARIKFGITNSSTRSKIFKSPFNTDYIYSAAEERGRYNERNATDWLYDGDVSLGYGKLLAEKHQINAIIGARFTESDTESSAFTLKGFSDDDVVSAIFAQAYDISARSTINLKRRTASYYVNLNYAFDNRYLLDASWRKDGSSVFGVNKHFTDTWAVGLGWNIHNEPFMKRQHFINYLKLRASIGNPGNQNFSDYISMKVYDYDTAFPTPWGSNIVITNYGNNNLKWQKTIDKNLGVDLFVFNNRLRLNFDIFEKNTDPLLLTLSLPSSAGARGIPTNLGSLVTKGYTLQANYQFIKKHDFIWSLNGSVRHIKSEYRDMGDALSNFNKENQSKNLTRYYDGASPTDLWAVKSLGIDPVTGMEMFQRKDGSMTFTYSYDDEVVVGNTEPDYEGVIGTSFYYKGFSVSANLRYRIGGQAFMSALYNKVENITTTTRWYNQDRRALYDRWKQPGDQTKFKRLYEYEVSEMSSRFVRDNNLLRGESFSVGYETQAPWLRKIGASSMTLRAYMNDLFNISSIKEERGIDYPFARSVSFSLGLRF